MSRNPTRVNGVTAKPCTSSDEKLFGQSLLQQDDPTFVAQIFGVQDEELQVLRLLAFFYRSFLSMIAQEALNAVFYVCSCVYFFVDSVLATSFFVCAAAILGYSMTTTFIP